jgi:hypothetical protein
MKTLVQELMIHKSISQDAAEGIIEDYLYSRPGEIFLDFSQCPINMGPVEFEKSRAAARSHWKTEEEKLADNRRRVKILYYGVKF